MPSHSIPMKSGHQVPDLTHRLWLWPTKNLLNHFSAIYIAQFFIQGVDGIFQQVCLNVIAKIISKGLHPGYFSIHFYDTIMQWEILY